jgi:hypothetical protein
MALDVRKFGPKSDKIGAHRGAFVYQETFKKDSSTASRVINEVVLEEEFSEVHLKGCAKSDELVILWPSSAALSSRLMSSTARLSSTAGFPAAAATPRSEGLGGGTRISRGGVVDAFTRDLELMEVIAAADAVVNARGSGGRGGLVGTRLLLDNPNGRSCRSRNRGGTRSLFSRSSKEGW